MGMGLCVLVGGFGSIDGDEVLHRALTRDLAQPCSGSVQGGLRLIFPWMLSGHVMEQGLILALPADDPLIGGARNQDLTENILPRGSKRKRQMITRYYLDACPHSLLSDPHLSRDDIVGAVLAENGLCSAWSS
eukprot:2554269-Amphidinium_carterae.1